MNPRTKKKIYKCKSCKKEIRKNLTGFCFKCFRENKKENYYKETIKKWKSGRFDGMRGIEGISRQIRRYLFKKFKNKCSKCGWKKVNQYTGKIPLTVEHKDGNYKNNNEENLDLICPNCHSLTATYCSRNKGRGRPRK